jgi:hypothetical protein
MERRWRRTVLIEINAGFAVQGVEEGPECRDARRGESTGGFEGYLRRECVDRALQAVACVGEGAEARVGAELGGGAEDADGADLLEDVGIAEERGFYAAGRVVGLVLADAVEHSGNFSLGETEVPENVGSALAGVDDVVPLAELLGVFRAVADEDAEVVEKGGGEEYVVVVVGRGCDGSGDLLGECVEARLVGVLVPRVGFAADVGFELGAEVGHE